MRPVILIHGYSAESTTSDLDAIHKIYGDLPEGLRVDHPIVEIDLSRWISLNDAVSIRDISSALDRCLRSEHANLLVEPGFDAIIHSTGALVIRSWVRLFSSKPSPLRNLVHLAGANLGSGWATIGQGQLARWLRYLGQGGAQRGLKVLQSLEFGSSKTLDLHLDLIQDGTRISEDYQIQEYNIVGSQPHPAWFEIPVPYAKEDGSDGVVRVSTSNLNFNYIRVGPISNVNEISWDAVVSEVTAAANRTLTKEYYRIVETSLVGVDRPRIPFAVPLQCAHGGDDTGIVSGTTPKAQVRRLIALALATPDRNHAEWQMRIGDFDKETSWTYQQVPRLKPSSLTDVLESVPNQYDPHSQLSFRFRDQFGDPIPVKSIDIFIISDQTGTETTPIQKLIEDTVISDTSPNVISFYLRVNKFETETQSWKPLLPTVKNVAIEITAVDPSASPTNPVVTYLPLRMTLTNIQLQSWIQGHSATVIDVQLLRIPNESVFTSISYPLPANPPRR